MGDSPPGAVGNREAELDGDIGRPDVDVLADSRDLFLGEEPLVKRYTWNDPIFKRELHIHVSEGIDADWSRHDVTWYTSGANKFQFVDEHDQHWRFDRHPNDQADEIQFHAPPAGDARTAVSSCMETGQGRRLGFVRGPGAISSNFSAHKSS